MYFFFDPPISRKLSYRGHICKKSYSLFILKDFGVRKDKKQSKCLTVGNWLNKLWYSHTVVHYAALRKEWEILCARGFPRQEYGKGSAVEACVQCATMFVQKGITLYLSKYGMSLRRYKEISYMGHLGEGG